MLLVVLADVLFFFVLFCFVFFAVYLSYGIVVARSSISLIATLRPESRIANDMQLK